MWDESHVGTVNVGDEVEVIGLVTDDPTFPISRMASSGEGMTTIEGCSVVVLSSGNELPEPVLLSADAVNADVCSIEAEQYESMLVRVEDVQVATCPNRVVGEDYEQCSSNIDLDDTDTWDKYYQSWLAPAGATDDSVIIELENHLFTWVAKCQAITGEPLDAIQGILVWESHHSGFNDRSSWDIVPRSIDDIVGCQAIPLDSVIDTTVTDLQQTENKYGPTLWGAIPPEKLSVDIGGTAPFPGESCPPPEFMLGAFFNATVREDPIVTRTHNLCQCFPVNYYNPSAGSQGSGAEYVRVTGIIQHTQQGAYGPYYFASDCVPHGGLYVYRSDDPSGIPLYPGDEIEVVARPYVYYGLEQLSNTLFLTVLSTGNDVCDPVEVTADPFGAEDGCNLDAEQYESRVVTVGPFTVTTVYNDVENPSPAFDGGVARSIGEYMQSSSCYDSNGDRFASCMVEIEDAEGNRMLIDNKFDAMGPYIEGLGLFAGEGRPLEVGDTCQSVTGIIEWFRGGYGPIEYGLDEPSPTPYGGSYRLHPLTPASLVGCSNGVDYSFGNRR